MNNNTIVIGGNHHNLLGVVRALGLNGGRPIAIITNDSRYAYTKRSKFIKKADVIPETENAILNTLLKYKNYNPKPIVIPTSDFAAAVIDKHYNTLKQYFILPNIDNCQNNIIKYMDKLNQYKLLKKMHLNIANSIKITFPTPTHSVVTKLNFPIIIKPLESIDGLKSDISICANERELSNAMTNFIKKGYSTALAQEYIKDKQEYCVIGFSNQGQIYIPGIIKKIRIFPKNRGSVSFGRVESLSENSPIQKNIKTILKKLNYTGLFDIEIFKKDSGEIYFNEINFRNSGNTFIYSSQKIYLAYLFVSSLLHQKIKNIPKTKKFYFIDTYLERRQLTSHNISLGEWLQARKVSSISFLYCRKDLRPTLWKPFYAILRRIDQRKICQ